MCSNDGGQNHAGRRLKPVAQTRKRTDAQLREVSWGAVPANLRHGHGVRHHEGRNLAIADWSMNASASVHGFVDNALFIDTKIAATIKADPRDDEHPPRDTIAYTIHAVCDEYVQGERYDNKVMEFAVNPLTTAHTIPIEPEIKQ